MDGCWFQLGFMIHWFSVTVMSVAVVATSLSISKVGDRFLFNGWLAWPMNMREHDIRHTVGLWPIFMA